MHILRVIGSMNPSKGGPCQGIRNSIPELEKIGVQNEVVCLDSPDEVFIKRDPFKIHALGPGKSSWYYSATLMPWLLENLSRFDAVIVHGLWQYHGYAVKKAIAQLRSQKHTGKNIPKVFVMPHGMLDPYFQKAKSRKLKAMRNWLYWKLIEGHVVNKADGVLFTCEAELELARQPFRPYNPKRAINIGYGITEPPVYSKAMQDAFSHKCPQVADSPYILFLSRIHDKKGVDLLIKAYAKLLESRVNHRLAEVYDEGETIADNDVEFPKLVIAGPGLDTAYGKYVQQLASATPELQHSIFFPGMLTGDSKWGAFYGCEAFVLPSHQENFGIAVVEALACSKPVLISDQVNIWREIKAAGGGIVAANTQHGTFKMLADWQDLSPEMRLIMGSMARETYENHFSIGPNVLRLLEAVRNS
ncbi:glycosyltransferase [uncultured Pontibacter sp.]|uniref:glycosyltransferase n=1 Tax=uncultured Pontibacter sp. TaxID=453356 RepID=UPI002607F136|nr:glycosyltransferase [uncultured Pontibacter sp.]